MLFEQINPFVRQALSAKLTGNNKNDVFNVIQSVDCRLFYILKGSGNMRFDSMTVPLSAGTVIIFSAGTRYVWEIDEVDYCAVNFDYTQSFSDIKRAFHPISSSEFSESDIIEKVHFENEPLLNEPLVLYSAEDLEREVNRIITEFLAKGDLSDVMTSALLKLVIAEAVKRKKRAFCSEHERANETVRHLIEFISKNYSKEIDYRSIEREFRFNPSYLNRVFKEHTGSSIYSFVLQYRMNVAMEILRTQNISVSQAAMLSGFPNPYHFTKAFTKQVGCSPTEYRRAYKSKGEDGYVQ